MIHQMCGGGLKNNQVICVIKVKFLNNPLALDRPYWYLNEIVNLQQGEKVYAPFGKNETEYIAEVLRVDNGVNEQSFPMSISKMQTVTKRA